ncbi:MAG: MerC domain-containing protein [Holophagaceae bacterium]|nr:MerC domain-containing protein [Holophagaceae bacterium]
MSNHTHPPALDLIGASASTLCAIHCAALPLVAAALPTLGIGWLGSGAVEWGLVGSSGLIAFLALRKGHRIHGRQAPRVVALLGFLAVVVSIFLESMGAWVTVLRVLGGFTMVLGHILNGLGCRVCALKVDHATREATPAL